MKKLEDMTLLELADYFSLDVHQRLLEEGGKGLKIGVYLAMERAISWYEAQEKKKAKGKRKH